MSRIYAIILGGAYAPPFWKEKRDGSFDVNIRLLFFTDSSMSRICAKYFGVRTLPLFASFNAFLRLLTPYRLAGKGCQLGVGRFLKVLGEANRSPIQCQTL